MKFFRSFYLLISFIFCIESYAFPQNVSSQKLNKEIEELNASIFSMKHASLGIIIKNLATGKIIYEINPALSLIPASVMKVPVTAAALSILGSNYQVYYIPWLCAEL